MKLILALNTLTNFADPSYDYLNKKKFCKEGKSFLKSLVHALELPVGDYTIKYSEGGIGVPGDIILHSTHLYVTISHQGPVTGVMLMFRSCKGQKDFTGQANHWIKLANLQTAETQERWIQTLKSMIAQASNLSKENPAAALTYSQAHLVSRVSTSPV